MSTATRLRAARAADVAGILELERLFPGDRMSPASVRRFLRVPSANVFVAESRGGEIVGALVLSFRRGCDWARLYSIAVAPSARGQGLGVRLMRRAERCARDRGCRGLRLEVREDNHVARGLYRRLGYDERQVLPDYYEDRSAGLRLWRDFSRKMSPRR